jgi:uncharacterized protein (DUF433 family)
MSTKNSRMSQRQDKRGLPAYQLVEASHYLGVPRSTVRSWVVGYPYRTKGGKSYFRPVITPASRDPLLLSFINLVEVHVLNAIRREHRVSLDKVRKAIDYLKKSFPSPHPLADQQFETDGVDLFVEKWGQLIGVSLDGQLAIQEIIRAHLRRVEWDAAGMPVRLYPFTRQEVRDEPTLVVIDPRIAFGQPVIVGTGIRTATVAERYKAGESIEELADDYGLQPFQIQEAIRCELYREAA